jgi:hypothetical protein
VCHRHPTWEYSLMLYNTARSRLGFSSSFFSHRKKSYWSASTQEALISVKYRRSEPIYV